MTACTCVAQGSLDALDCSKPYSLTPTCKKGEQEEDNGDEDEEEEEKEEEHLEEGEEDEVDIHKRTC